MKQLLLFTLALFTITQLQAQGWGQTQKIVPSDRAQADYFGWAVAMDGDYAVVGAYLDDLSSSDMGSAYVYKKDSNGNWIEHQKLIAPDKRQFDQFGFSVDIDGDYIIIGALGQDYDENNSNFIGVAGAVYVYEKDTNDNWNFVKKLVASQRETTRQLGRCVAISGEYAIVGLDREDFDVSGENEVQNAGAAYIYERNTSGLWNEVQKIVASERSTFDYFGYNGLDIDGNYAVIGAMQEDEDENGANTILSAGAAYIFERDTNGVWNEIQKVVASDREQGEYFGFSVALDGDNLVIGASQEYVAGNTSAQYGAVYMFENNSNGLWVEVQKVNPSYFEHQSKFGQSVSIDGDNIIVGAYREDLGNASDGGAAFMFNKDGTGVWNEVALMYDVDANTSDEFGFSVAISGDNAMIGSYKQDEDETGMNNLSQAGSAYVFNINEPNTLPPLNTLSVVENDFFQNIRAYPNPVNDILNLDLGEFFNSVDITINNILGQQVFFQNYQNTKLIELPFNMQKGMYLVEVKIDNKATSILKIVKQ